MKTTRHKKAPNNETLVTSKDKYDYTRTLFNILD